METISDNSKLKLDIYYVELRAIRRSDEKIIRDIVSKINKSHEIMSPTLESINKVFNQYVIEKHFVLVLHSEIIKAMKQSIIRVKKELMSFKYDYIYITASGSRLGITKDHSIFNKYGPAKS